MFPYDCLETLQIWQDAEKIVEYLNVHGDIPTILTGDLNIRNESMAIKVLRENSNNIPADSLIRSADLFTHYFRKNLIILGSA